MKKTIAFIRFIIALPISLPILLLFEVFILVGGDYAKELIVRIVDRLMNSYE